MEMETEFRLPYFHFPTSAYIRLKGSSDKLDTTEQIVSDFFWNSDILFSWAPTSLQMVTAAMKLKNACSLEKLWPT